MYRVRGLLTAVALVALTSRGYAAEGVAVQETPELDADALRLGAAKRSEVVWLFRNPLMVALESLPQLQLGAGLEVLVLERGLMPTWVRSDAWAAQLADDPNFKGRVYRQEAPWYEQTGYRTAQASALASADRLVLVYLTPQDHELDVLVTWWERQRDEVVERQLGSGLHFRAPRTGPDGHRCDVVGSGLVPGPWTACARELASRRQWRRAHLLTLHNDGWSTPEPRLETIEFAVPRRQGGGAVVTDVASDRGTLPQLKKRRYAAALSGDVTLATVGASALVSGGLLLKQARDLRLAAYQVSDVAGYDDYLGFNDAARTQTVGGTVLIASGTAAVGAAVVHALLKTRRMER